MTCIATTDCAEISTGCCMSSMVDSVAEDSVWGTEEAYVVGAQPSMCVSAEY